MFRVNPRETSLGVLQLSVEILTIINSIVKKHTVYPHIGGGDSTIDDVFGNFIQILDFPLIWVLMRVMSFCSRVVNKIVPQDVMPHFVGMNFGVFF